MPEQSHRVGGTGAPFHREGNRSPRGGQESPGHTARRWWSQGANSESQVRTLHPCPACPPTVHPLLLSRCGVSLSGPLDHHLRALRTHHLSLPLGGQLREGGCFLPCPVPVARTMSGTEQTPHDSLLSELMKKMKESPSKKNKETEPGLTEAQCSRGWEVPGLSGTRARSLSPTQPRCSQIQQPRVINTPVLGLLRAWESNNLGQKWRWLHLLLARHLPVVLFLPQFLSLAHGTCHSTDTGGEGFGRNLQSWPFLRPFPPEAGLGRPEGLRLQPGTPALGTRGWRCCEEAPPTHGASGAGLGGPRFLTPSLQTGRESRGPEKGRDGPWTWRESTAAQAVQEPGGCRPAQGSPLPEHRRCQAKALSAPRGHRSPPLCLDHKGPRVCG
ncbi:uncharacterized protein LOC130683335 [Manis pentadactyla]|uniref:uncharacterized protein LOC130683335 n=1 Tax=Manis pentadactyla TaxID=143292 RepID=UPI00255C53BD|nr:uncharacterized protein LOC130683335 [Manis pentadactyla]